MVGAPPRKAPPRHALWFYPAPINKTTVGTCHSRSQAFLIVPPFCPWASSQSPQLQRVAEAVSVLSALPKGAFCVSFKSLPVEQGF